MELETIALISIPVTFAGLVLFEHLRPARPLPKMPGWRRKGLLFFVLTNAAAIFGPPLWLEHLGHLRLVELEHWGVLGGAAITFLLVQFCVYWWHRSMHRSSFLWRTFHQLHHSAERLDTFGANYFHPLDVLGFAFWQTLVPSLLGVSAGAAVTAGIVGLFYSLFQHTNVKTPRFIGYFIQRPESHSVHHGRGIHGYNYADLPLWDLVFGTFRNPARFEADAGFWHGASEQVLSMLVARDVSRPHSSSSKLERAVESA